MDHLILFENFHSDGYIEISSMQFYQLEHGEEEDSVHTTIDFNENELSKIKRIFNNIPIKQETNSEGNVFIKIEDSRLFITITKLDDEWYGVYFCDAGNHECDDVSDYNEWYESHERYFKCDQYDGLIECLEYLKTII